MLGVLSRSASIYNSGPTQRRRHDPLSTPTTLEEGARLDRYLELAGKYFELKISEAIFAGDILQAAYMAIRLFSRNTAIPDSCASFVKPEQDTVLPFCIGKEQYGIPLGLIIYAGRNQYAHWDDEKLTTVNAAVFAALNDAFYDHPFADLAFDLGNPTIPIYAREILVTALGWTTYENYLAEMKQLPLSPRADARTGGKASCAPGTASASQR